MAALLGTKRVKVTSAGELAYVPELEDVGDVHGILALLESRATTAVGSIPAPSLADAYIGAEEDMHTLKMQGRVLYIRSMDATWQDVVSARPDSSVCRVPLHVKVNARKGATTVATTADLRAHLFRGDAIDLGGATYRVCTSVRTAAGIVPYAPSRTLATGRSVG